MKNLAPALRMADAGCDEDLFNPEFQDKSWQDLLAYFKNRSHVHYLPVNPGKLKHVTLADCILDNVFIFNHERHQLDENFDWTVNPSKDIEWHILLHKFYYLKELAGAYGYTRDERYSQKWMSLISSWIKQVPDGFIDSQVTGRRLQQWIGSFNAFITEYRSPSVTPEFLEMIIRSINSQTHFLCHHLTPEGNHRTLELYAIFLTAVNFPELALSDWYLAFSRAKLLENMRTDLLVDGVHRELSTDYHHTVLKNYLRFRELAYLNGLSLPAECESLLKKAIQFSCYAHKPDGLIPAINDGDCNSYLGLLGKTLSYYPDDVVRYVVSQGREGTAPAERSRVFAESGYVILRSGWTAENFTDAGYMFFDCGKLGFGSHGHYDMLNFELAAYGRSLIVDPGRYTYHDDNKDGINWRHYFKGTAGHNTVVVDGLDQIPYRPGRPAEPEPQAELIRFASAPDFDFVHGRAVSHRYAVSHERIIYCAHPEYWFVADILTAQEKHRYDLYFHLSQEAQDKVKLEAGPEGFVVNSPHLIVTQAYQPAIALTVEQGFVSPEYGVKHKAPVLRFSQTPEANTGFYSVLYPYREKPPGLKLSQIPVYLNGRLCAQDCAFAVKLETQLEAVAYTDYIFINRAAHQGEFQFGDVSCAGLLLFIRLDEAGKIIKLQGEALSLMTYRSQMLINSKLMPIRLGYQEQKLSISNGADNWLSEIKNLEKNKMDERGFNLQGVRRWFS